MFLRSPFIRFCRWEINVVCDGDLVIDLWASACERDGSLCVEAGGVCWWKIEVVQEEEPQKEETSVVSLIWWITWTPCTSWSPFIFLQPRFARSFVIFLFIDWFCCKFCFFLIWAVVFLLSNVILDFFLIDFVRIWSFHFLFKKSSSWEAGSTAILFTHSRIFCYRDCADLN